MIIKRWTRSAVWLILLVLLCGSIGASAVQTGRDCTLTIHFRYEGEGIEGAAFQLYRVADVNAHQKYTPVFPFEDCDGDPFLLSEMTLGLRDRVVWSGALPDYTLVTDAQGNAVVTGLEPGAWLLMSEPTVDGDYTHYVDPQIIFMPVKSDQEYVYDIPIHPKGVLLPSYVELTTRTLVKTWDDAGQEADRPGSITVRLLKDGQVMDRVVLSEETQWQYTWTELLPSAVWTVEEEVPEGYTPELRAEKDGWLLINRRTDIPQTGHIWWPVAVCVGGGLLLMVLGIWLRRSGRHEA